MRAILMCAALVFLGFGCSGNLDPDVAQDEEALVGNGATTAVNCDSPPTCLAACTCEATACRAEGGGAKYCDEEKFQCALDCKKF